MTEPNNNNTTTRRNNNDQLPQQRRGLSRKMGAAERLGNKSGPTPEATLDPRNLKQARNPGRYGQIYEKASSRQSREKEALKRNGEISRDGAVPLGGLRRSSVVADAASTSNYIMTKTKTRVFQDVNVDEQMEWKGKERTSKLVHANNTAARQQQQARLLNAGRNVMTASINKKPQLHARTSKRIMAVNHKSSAEPPPVPTTRPFVSSKKAPSSSGVADASSPAHCHNNNNNKVRRTTKQASRQQGATTTTTMPHNKKKRSAAPGATSHRSNHTKKTCRAGGPRSSNHDMQSSRPQQHPDAHTVVVGTTTTVSSKKDKHQLGGTSVEDAIDLCD